MLRRIGAPGISFTGNPLNCRLVSTASHSALHPSGLLSLQYLDNPNDVTLNSLRDNDGAKRVSRRVGRGIGSSKGKTCGRGMNGQKSRPGGGTRPGFEGGQTPLYKRVRKYGFRNGAHREVYVPVNLGKLQLWIDQGRIQADTVIDMKVLVDSGLVNKLSKRNMCGIKLLADGAELIRSPIHLVVSRASNSARLAVEASGGSVKEVYYHRLAIQRALRADGTLPEPQPYLPSVGRLPPKSRRAEYFAALAERNPEAFSPSI